MEGKVYLPDEIWEVLSADMNRETNSRYLSAESAGAVACWNGEGLLGSTLYFPRKRLTESCLCPSEKLFK